MLARFHVQLPFCLAIPVGVKFPPCKNTIDDGYPFMVYPPVRGEHTPSLGEGEKLEVGGTSAVQAELLRIDFYKESFARNVTAPTDPPEGVLRNAVNWFLIRLRHVAQAPQIRPLNFPWVTFHLKYLNDDETELREQEGLPHGRHRVLVSNKNIPIDNTLWEEVCQLPQDFKPRPWQSLLLDAREELPDIGSAMVLSSTALEVFIARVLDELVHFKNFA